MMGLFDNDPVFKGKKRDSKGRFATAERAMYDKATKENSWLRLRVEKVQANCRCVGRCVYRPAENYSHTITGNSRPPKRVGKT